MTESLQDASHIINLIYETAEDLELWPTLLEFCETELEVTQGTLEVQGVHRGETDLAEHLERALRLNRRINAMQDEIGSAKKVLDCLPVAVMTVDASCTVVNLNRLAQKVVDSSNLLRIEQGKLMSHSAPKQADLMAIVSSALAVAPDVKKPSSIKLQGDDRNAISIFAVKTADQKTQKHCCTLFIVSNFLSNHVSPAALRYMYQLTPAESRLAHKLLSGDSLKDIAEQLGITHNTARNQLKAIFSKTDTKRQSELVGLLLSTPSEVPVESSSDAANKSFGSEAQAKKCMQLSDGRTLFYYEFGEPDGVPVIYFHEFMVWRWWMLAEETEFRALGIRMIVPLRPGFLGSDVTSSFSLASWKGDFEEFVRYLQLGKYFLMGFSSGGLFATAAAYYFPQKCRGLALVSSSAPLEAMSEVKDVKPPMSRLIMGFAKFAPRLYQRFFKALLETVQEKPINYFRGYISHWSDYDRNLMANHRVLQSISDCFRRTLAVDARGVTNEPVICTQTWEVSLNDIHTPTQIWQGAADSAVPNVLAKKLHTIPSSKVFVVPGMGHLFIYDYWSEILTSLIDSVSNEAESAAQVNLNEVAG